jgi:hypothetical protein
MAITLNGTGFTMDDGGTIQSARTTIRAYCVWNPQNSTIARSLNASSISGGWTINWSINLGVTNYASFGVSNALYPPDPYARQNAIGPAANKTATSFYLNVRNGGVTNQSVCVFTT